MLISFSGHLTNGDVNVPSQDIANCISKFLSCTDDKSEGDLMKTSNNCYHDFQSCSGSDIEISEGKITIFSITFIMYKILSYI